MGESSPASIFDSSRTEARVTPSPSIPPDAPVGSARGADAKTENFRRLFPNSAKVSAHVDTPSRNLDALSADDGTLSRNPGTLSGHVDGLTGNVDALSGHAGVAAVILKPLFIN